MGKGKGYGLGCPGPRTVEAHLVRPPVLRRGEHLVRVKLMVRVRVRARLGLGLGLGLRRGEHRARAVTALGATAALGTTAALGATALAGTGVTALGTRHEG